MQDIYTGLRIPTANIIGRNWTLYLCLHKSRDNFPADVMFIINQFLNWIPAGCWYTPINKCIICGIGVCNTDEFCSIQCYESEMRNTIIEEYQDSVNLINASRNVDISCLSYVLDSCFIHPFNPRLYNITVYIPCKFS